jgi:hypothetical protein
MRLKPLFSAALVALGVWAGACAGPAQAQAERSVREWAHCDGVADDQPGLARAVAAAAHNAFVLKIDCPVFVHTGMDVARAIFIDSGVQVDFAPGGLFVLDDVFTPAFVIANSSDIVLRGWRVKYVGGDPVDLNVGYYLENGVRVPVARTMPIQARFFDKTLHDWLMHNRGVTYAPHSNPLWAGPTATSALFYITGASSRVTFDDMTVFAPKGVGGDKFAPVIFAMEIGVKSNRTFLGAPAISVDDYAVPDHLTFRSIDLDGFYMGWAGTARTMTISNVRAHRYGDLQDAQGGNVGGHSNVGASYTTWFAPPHLFYINYGPTWDPSLHASDVHISDVIDYGNRVGVARDTPEHCCSGYADSLKIGADNSTVDNYKSFRPDGFIDIFPCHDLTISNASGVYDSSFDHELSPGIRLTSAGYRNVTLRNITLTDIAKETQWQPFAPTADQDPYGITISNMRVSLNAWTGTRDGGRIIPYYFAGGGHHVRIDYLMRSTGQQIVVAQEGHGAATLAVQPGTPGGPSMIHWGANKSITNCVATGAWSGGLGPSGSATAAVAAGQRIGLDCAGTDGRLALDVLSSKLGSSAPGR